jgi:hypothetical protein
LSSTTASSSADKEERALLVLQEQVLAVCLGTLPRKAWDCSTVNSAGWGVVRVHKPVEKTEKARRAWRPLVEPAALWHSVDGGRDATAGFDGVVGCSPATCQGWGRVSNPFCPKYL